MSSKKVVIVVPVYNEEDKIGETIEGLMKIDIINQIVVVDDGSTDNTRSILQNFNNVRVIALNKNYGKGYAIKKAIEEIDCDIMGFVDGDVGLTSYEVKKLIMPVLLDNTDFTIAMFPSAYKNTKQKGGFGLVKKLAKKGVYHYTGKIVNTSLSGQRVYKKKILNSLKYIPNNYGIEVAMTIQAINNGYRYKEIPVEMTHRYTDRSIKGFKHRGKQFFDILKTLIMLYFRR